MSFVKTDPAPLEAVGLRWLAEDGASCPRRRVTTGTTTTSSTGWRDRLALWQRFPLLVHAVLFGGSYLARSREVIGRLSG